MKKEFRAIPKLVYVRHHFISVAFVPVHLYKRFQAHWRAFNRCNGKALTSNGTEANYEKM